MAQLPSPRTFSQIQQLIRQVFVQKSGVNDLYQGSSINSFIDAAAQSDFRSQGDILAALNAVNIDRAEGSDLDNIGASQDIIRPQALASSGFVNFSSTNFTKIATSIYAGAAAPPIGSVIISVSDASIFPASGSVYIGRGSNNIEGPIPYSSITPVGNFYQINLSSPTTKNHNVNESVVLAHGGNRNIPIGTTVQTPANTTAPAVSFTTLVNATIPDGEDTLQNVPVVCTQVGTLGNVPAGSITSFPSPSYNSAAVTNPLSFVTGADQMSDPNYRLLIKNTEQSKVKGTELAIDTAAVGVTAPDENKTVASAQLLEPSNRNEPGVLYIDDGTGYEPIFAGQGFEQVISDANGGEKYLQLQHEDVTKALLVSTFTTPFALTGNMTLSIKVGGVLSEHTFADSDFATQNAAAAFEVINSINANTSLLYSARTINNSTQIIIFAKNFEFEDLQIVKPSGINANDFLGFDENLTYSLRLYKNDVLLIKDGVIPTLFSEPQSSWLTMSSGETLNIKLDQSIFIAYTFTDADFVPFGYNTLSQNNSLASWANVFNNKVAGLTVTVQGNQLQFQSNKGANSLALIEINSSGSSVATKMFGFASGVMQSNGLTSDYALNRATGQIELNIVANPGDNYTAGSKNTRAFLNSASISTGTVNLPASTVSTAPPILWALVDSPALFIQNNATTATQITITNPSTNVWRFTSSVGSAFSNVQIGDWVNITDDAIYAQNPNFIGAWRVSAVSSNFFEFYMTQSLGSTAATFSLVGPNTLSFIRSDGDIQQINLLTGSQTLTAIANNINSEFQGGFASATGGQVLKLSTDSYSPLDGFLMLTGMTNAAVTLGFVVGDSDTSTVSHTAFAESETSEVTMPTFVYDSIATGTASIPPINLITTTSEAKFVNDWIEFLNPYGHVSSNKDLYAQAASISGVNLTLRPQAKLRDVIANDRYFPASPYLFTSSDNLVVILDEDSVNKALNIPLSRKGVVNGVQVPTTTQFKAYDADAGPTANFPNQFGNNFNFQDFFLYFNARQVLIPAGANNKMLLRSAQFGPTGENIRFGIAYPTLPAAPLSNSVVINRYTDIKVFLASGPQRLGGAWDSTTQFDVTNTVGNTWRYIYNGIGTSPNFVGGASIATGDIININNTSNFSPDNTGQFQVTSVTNTYFEVTNVYGVAENNIQLNAASDLIFYPLAGSNTASSIGTYVNSNLSSYLTISQLQSGAGVVSTSTYDDQAGTSEYVALVDGFNALASSNIGTTSSPVNQFTLKIPLTISDINYSIIGENFYIIPCTADQIQRFLNIFAVTGLSSIGNISVSGNAGKIQIYSDLFGSSGAVLVSGGSANAANGALSDTGESVQQAILLAQPEGLVRSGGSTVTAYTTQRHGLNVGDVVEIINAQNTTFDGTFTVTAVTAKSFQYTQTQPVLNIAAPATGAVRVSNIVTITTTTPHFLAADDRVTIASVTDASFDGTFIVAAIPSSTTFTYNQAGVNATSGNGNVTNVASGLGEVERPFGEISINIANQAGFQAGQWILLQNTATQPKATGFDITTDLQITGFDTLTITSGSGSFQTARTHSGDNTTQIKVEKQAQFMAFSWTGTGTAPNFVAGGVSEGDWVNITGSFNLINQGIYKIEKIFGNNSFYIINPNGIEEDVTLSAGTNLKFYSYDSIMPGDQLLIESNILGASNIGSYTVAASPFPTSTSIVTTTNFFANASSTNLGSQFNQVIIKEKTPFFAYRKILNITPDPANINALLLITDSDALVSKNNLSSGSEVSAISKLNFSTTVQVGEDSYKYYLGLIHEVGKVIRGQADDPVNYPGVEASGAYIEIESPLPQRIQVSIVVRNTSGIPFSTIQYRVQSAVASYINSLGIGEPVVFSEMISQVQALNGIQAVSIASPNYSTAHDEILVPFNSKALVINLTSDVLVSLAQ